jgi:hypothetical protein
MQCGKLLRGFSYKERTMKKLLHCLILILISNFSYAQTTGSNQPLLLANPYFANPVHCDGTWYASRGAALTGVSDSRVGTFSVWIRVTGSNGTLLRLFGEPLAGNVAISRNASNFFRFALYNVNGTSAGYDVNLTTTTITADGKWHHILAAWDTASGPFVAYIDDIAQTISVTASGNVTINYAGSNSSICSLVGGGSSDRFNGDVSNFYFNMATKVDITQAANRALFSDSNGKPVYLGPNCTYPTGSQPAICLANPTATFLTNLGSGGDYTTTAGTLTTTTLAPITPTF